MHENIPVTKNSTEQVNEEQVSAIENVTADSRKVAQKLREYVTEQNATISDEAILSASQALVDRSIENGKKIDFDNLPLKEMIDAREQVATTGAPVIDGVTGEVISHADSVGDARMEVQKHNEEKRENM